MKKWSAEMLTELLVDGGGFRLLGVEADDVRQHQCDGVAVGDVEDGGQRVGGGVGGTEHAVLNGGAGHGGTEQHAGARLDGSAVIEDRGYGRGDEAE